MNVIINREPMEVEDPEPTVRTLLAEK